MSVKSERSCSREFRRRQIRTGRRRGRPRAGVASARARQTRDARSASPSERLHPPGWARARTRFEEGGGLAAAPWERCRSTACPEVIRRSGRHPDRRAPPQVSEGCAANAFHGDRATGDAGMSVGAPGATSIQSVASPPLSAPNRKERWSRVAVLRPSRWFTWVSSFAGFSVSASRRAPRLRGCTARRVNPPLGATRVRRMEHPRRGVDGGGTRQTVSDRRPRSLPPGEGLEVEGQARGVTSGVL